VEAAGVGVIPNDLARIVDALYKGAEGTLFRGIVECRVSAAAFEKAVGLIGAIVIVPDDLARVVDARCNGAEGVRREVVEGGVSAAA
jgi:hypothetical protein